MPQVNQLQNLLLAQAPLNVRAQEQAGEDAVQRAAAPTGPYSSRAAGLLKALQGGIGGLMEGSAIHQAMQGQQQSRQQLLALADIMNGNRPGTPVGAPIAAAAPPMPQAMGQGGIGSDTRAVGNPTGYDPKATEALIRARAPAYGISPDAAVAIARSEGLNSYRGDGGSSFGPFQLHYGGVAGGGNAVGGLGDAFTRQSGLDARDPATVPQQVDFALSQAAQGGWGPWHGRKTVGMGVWDGIGHGADPGISAAPQTAASQIAPTRDSTQMPAAGAPSSSGPGISPDAPAPGAHPVSMAGLPPGVTPAMFAASQNVGGPSDGNALHRQDEVPAGMPPYVPGQAAPPTAAGAAPVAATLGGPDAAAARSQALVAALQAPRPATPTSGTPLAAALNGFDGPATAGAPVVPPPQGLDTPATGAGLSGPQSDAAAPIAAPPPAPQDDSIRGLLEAGFAGDPAQAGPAVIPDPQGAADVPPPSTGAGLAGPQTDAAMGNAPEPSIRDALVAALGNGAGAVGPHSDAAMGNGVAPPPAPAAPIDLSAGLNGTDPLGADSPSSPVAAPPPAAPMAAASPSVAPPIPADPAGAMAGFAPSGTGPTAAAATPPPAAAAASAPASAGPAPSAGAPLPVFASGKDPRSAMLAAMLSGQQTVGAAPGPATAGGSPDAANVPLPPPRPSDAALGLNPDAPAPGAQPAGPAPLPQAAASPPLAPQPLGVAGNSALADPSSPQNFQRQQLAQALATPQPGPGAGASDPRALAAVMQGRPIPSAALSSAGLSPGGGLLGGLFGLGSGLGGGRQPAGMASLSSPPGQPSSSATGAAGAPISAPSGPATGGGLPQAPGQGAPAGQGPMGNYSQARAVAAQILSSPYSQPAAVEFAGKILFPQMQTVSAADGKTYLVNPMTGETRMLFDGGVVMKPDDSFMRNGQFAQAPHGPIDVAPGNSVVSFGANNQAIPQVRTPPTPDFKPIDGTSAAFDSHSGAVAPLPAGAGGYTTSLDLPGGTKVPIRVTPDPAGGQPKIEYLTPPAQGAAPGQPAATTGDPLGGVQPLVDRANAMKAQGDAQAKEAETQVTSLDKMAQAGVDARAKVSDLNDLKTLSGNFGAGSGPMVAKWLGQHGWVTKGSSDVEAYQGLAGYIATQMRQQGSGALRNQEMDKFQADLGNLQMSPEARLDAINRAQRMFGRIGDMGDIAANSRIAPQARIDQIHALASQPYGAPLGQEGSPAQGAQSASGSGQAPKAAPVRVQTPAEAMALPPGTLFVTPDGRTKVR